MCKAVVTKYGKEHGEMSNKNVDKFTENRIGMEQSSILIDKTEASILGDCKTERDIEFCRKIWKSAIIK